MLETNNDAKKNYLYLNTVKERAHISLFLMQFS